MSLDVVGGAPGKVTELIKSDSAKWKKVIDDAGIKVVLSLRMASINMDLNSDLGESLGGLAHG